MIKPFLSIVIPTFNGMTYLKECLPSVNLAVNHAPFECEIILVDDGSGDHTADWVREEYPRIRMIVRKENGGFARAANTGMCMARGQWIALLNNDVVLDADWIMASFKRKIEPDVGALATRILRYEQKDLISSAGDEYASCGFPLQWLDGRPENEDRLRTGCFSACAAACFYRKEALKKIGFFREFLSAYLEDVELGFRLNLAGYRCEYISASRCWHVGSGSYGIYFWKRLYNSTRNREILFWGNMPNRLLLKYLPAHVYMVLLQLVWSVRAGGFLPKLAGVLGSSAHITKILAMRKEARELTRISTEEFERRMHRRWFQSLVLRRLRSL